MPETTRNPRPTDRFEARDLGEEFLFYDVDSDRVHALNGTAREIYLLCDGSRSEGEVSEAFASKYAAEGTEARRDAADTIRQLLELGLLRC